MEAVEIQRSGLTTTDILALVGAFTGVLGTVAGVSALVWDFYKWRYAERVRLKVSATPGFVELGKPGIEYINVTVTNVGKISTTIKLLSFHGFNSKKELKKRNGQSVQIVRATAYGELPVRLDPGDDWTGGCRQDMAALVVCRDFKFFFVQIEDTLSDFPFRAEIDKSRIWKL